MALVRLQVFEAMRQTIREMGEDDGGLGPRHYINQPNAMAIFARVSNSRGHNTSAQAK